MSSMNMHPEWLPCSQVFVAQVTGDSRSLHVFGLDVVHNVRRYIADVPTDTALVAVTSFEIQSLNGSIELLKWINNKT